MWGLSFLDFIMQGVCKFKNRVGIKQVWLADRGKINGGGGAN